MSVNDFVTLCKTKLRLYLDNGDDYEIYVLWKDFWTIGSPNDNTKSLDNQRCILGTSENDGYFDFSYVKSENKLYMKAYTMTDSETYTVQSQEEPGL